MEAKKHKYSKLYCPHCNKEVLKSTWYTHHSRFFNPTTKPWDKHYMYKIPFDFRSAEIHHDERSTITHEFANLDLESLELDHTTPLKLRCA